MSNYQEDPLLKKLFKNKKADIEKDAPTFINVFQKAANLHAQKRRQKWMMAALVIGFLFVFGFNYQAKQNGTIKETTEVARASSNFYEILLANGKIVTNDIHFDYNNPSIKPSSMPIIESLAEMLIKHPSVELSIEGHTDSDGTLRYNQRLSTRRALVVKFALLRLGIASDRLTVRGWGESKPIESNETEEGRAINRRVEFVHVQ